MKTFLLYLFDSDIQDYRPFKLNLPYREIRSILKQTLSPQQWRYFLDEKQCDCPWELIQRLGYDASCKKEPFLKQIDPYDQDLFHCTFCFQTNNGIYFFNFYLSQSRYKGRLAKILQNIQTHLFIPLNKEEREVVIKALTPKHLTVRCLNLASIQKLLDRSLNSFVCLSHHFKHIPHIREVIDRNFCFDDPFFCYWFLYINNQDDNDTKACNLLLSKNVSSICNRFKMDERSYYELSYHCRGGR